MKVRVLFKKIGEQLLNKIDNCLAAVEKAMGHQCFDQDAEAFLNIKGGFLIYVICLFCLFLVAFVIFLLLQGILQPIFGILVFGSFIICMVADAWYYIERNKQRKISMVFSRFLVIAKGQIYFMPFLFFVGMRRIYLFMKMPIFLFNF
ncbi:MAG: hypothetical protein ABIE43_00735 [Patescibacteria group bacterium]